MVWLSGQKLHGDRYIIQKQLGKGGAGITYLAKDKKGNLVVIKTLKDEVLTDPERAAFLAKYQHDFRDEALRLALCRHPHIVRIDNAFHEGQLPCMAMEYVEGVNLWQHVNQQGVLSEREALLYIRQIGEALTTIHDKGLLHRDVKPPNIMVRAGKLEAVLIDFGIAREFIPDVTLTQPLAVSNGFAPIEQYAQRARRGEYTDVYALAATLYFLLTATVPSPAFVRAARVALEPPQLINSSISNGVNRAILKGMEFEPENRPQSVLEWLELLEFDRVDNIAIAFTSVNLHEQPQTTTLSPATPVKISQDNLIPNSFNANSDLSDSLTPSENLNLEVGEDYSNLRDLLATGKWQEADEETAALMLKIADREADGWLECEDIENFPDEDLRIINHLWMRYSNDRFGFSVQKRIYEDCGQDYIVFGDRIGWRVHDNWLWWNNLTFSIHAPLGHLPSWRIGGSGGIWGCFVTGGGFILSRPDL